MSTCLLLLAANGTIAGWSLWAGIIILCREILVSGLREYLAGLKVSVPVTQLAKWKTTLQLVAVGFLIAGKAGDAVLPVVTPMGLTLLWLSALLLALAAFFAPKATHVQRVLAVRGSAVDHSESARATSKSKPNRRCTHFFEITLYSSGRKTVEMS